MIDETRLTYEGEFDLRKMLDLSRVTIHGQVVEIPVERKFADIESVQRYVDRVLALNWVRADYPRAATSLRVMRKESGTNGAYANCGGGVMRIPVSTTVRWALREIVVLHEIAHHLRGAGGGHGVGFRVCFAHLVEELIGPEAAWILRVNWMDLGLSVQASSSLV